MNKMKINIGGRKFELPIIIKQFPGKEISDIQLNAVEEFENHKEIVDSAKVALEKYILENGLKANGIETVDNIFKYVMPKSISVPKDKDRVIAIMCNYKFDMEHGLAIIFENEKFKNVGPQDLIL